MFIRDPGSVFFFIPDPNVFHTGSRIRIKEIKYFNRRKMTTVIDQDIAMYYTYFESALILTKWFLSTLK
jgi:hypothetical protein